MLLTHRSMMIAAAAVFTIAPAIAAQTSPTRSVRISKEPATTTTTTTTTTSGGDVALTPWMLPADQFNADLETVPVPTGCAATVDRAAVARISISSDLYQPGMISPDSAKFLAVCAIPGQVTSGEMHAENGRTLYEVTLIPDRRSTNAKVIVDANTGQVLSSKTYGGLRGLAGYLRENVEREQNKNPAALDTLRATQPQNAVPCTMESRPALQLTVLDENGMALAPGTSLRVTAREGSYADSNMFTTDSTNSSFALAYERPGTYQIEVNVPGYAPATISNIVVARSSDGCHVSTRQLTAQLHR